MPASLILRSALAGVHVPLNAQAALPWLVPMPGVWLRYLALYDAFRPKWQVRAIEKKNT